MIILLILWMIFVFGYLIFNIYGLSRIISLRIKGDSTLLVVLIYIITILVILFVSIAIISTLNWRTDWQELLKG